MKKTKLKCQEPYLFVELKLRMCGGQAFVGRGCLAQTERREPNRATISESESILFEGSSNILAKRRSVVRSLELMMTY
jgi:hypothetical protein